MRKNNFSFSVLAFLLLSIVAVPISTLGVQQKTEVVSQQPTIFGKISIFGFHQKYQFEPRIIDIQTTGSSLVPPLILLTNMLTIDRVISIMTHRPFT
jgi:hypothetical protein